LEGFCVRQVRNTVNRFVIPRRPGRYAIGYYDTVRTGAPPILISEEITVVEANM
jgi:hypothetical protein